jgi:N utilization substance protein A
LSYDDLSVMEISDLVNTIEGLVEEQAVDIVARAEALAEEQAEEMPRRKGARAAAPVAPEGGEEVSAEGGEGRAARAARPTLDDLFGTEALTADVDYEQGEGDESEGPREPLADDAEGSDLTGAGESDEIRDLALANEPYTDHDGHEVTSPPSDADQDETARIVTEAVEAGRAPRPIEAQAAGAGRNVPPLPPTEPFSTDEVEGRDSEMHQP